MRTFRSPRENKNIQGCGFFFSIPTPPDAVLLSMKLAALLSRAKGRDFYDVMFLMQQTEPSYEFLSAVCDIKNARELKEALMRKLQMDFEHLLFSANASERILRFGEFINERL